MKLDVSAIQDINYNDAIYANTVPTYLRSYTKFYTFIKLITEYVRDSISVLNNMDKLLHTCGAVNTAQNEYSRSVMSVLCANYGILGTNVQKDEDIYNALQCIGTRRRAFSTLNDIRQGFLESAKVVRGYTITDQSVLDGDKKKLMACTLELLAGSELSLEFMMSNVVPQVTGVEFSQRTLYGDVFAYNHESISQPENSIKYAGWNEGNWAQEIIIQR